MRCYFLMQFYVLVSFDQARIQTYARTQMRILVHQKGKNETSKYGIKSAA